MLCTGRVNRAGNNVIRLVLPNGTITTFAGTGAAAYSGNGGLATAAALSGPTGVAYDNVRNITYIADTGNNAIRCVLPLMLMARLLSVLTCLSTAPAPANSTLHSAT